MNKSKKILLLGGTGAIGAYTSLELVKLGYEVYITSRSERKSTSTKIKYIRGDAQDITFLNDVLKEHYDVIIDFMIYSTDSFSSRVNTLLGNCRQYIYLSSYRVFGDADVISETSPKLLDVIKDRKFLATDEYALTKARQENILTDSSKKNWTIVRPSITYSTYRFQFGTMEQDTFIWRALNDGLIPLPSEITQKRTTMTWAGDTGRLIAKLVLNKKAFGNDFNIASQESHTWSDIASIYKYKVPLKIKNTSLRDYFKATGNGDNDKYLVKYNRKYNRIFDSSKIFTLTGESQEGMMPLKDGLLMELTAFLKNPTFTIDYATQARFDKVTRSQINLSEASKDEIEHYFKAKYPVRKKIKDAVKKIYTRLKDIKRKIRIRTRLRELRRKLNLRAERRRYGSYAGAILTLTGYYNYGNILQRYALQKFLKSSGKNFVSYWNEQDYGRIDDESQLVYTKDFVKRNIVCKQFDPLDRFSAYIVGSDQVWRNWGYKDLQKDLGYYFFNFIEDSQAKRIAYAASIGQEKLEDALIDSTTAKYLEPYVKKIDYVGMREGAGSKIVKEEWGVDSVEVLDPTMLLEANEYSKLIDNCPYDLPDVNETIFTYFILSNGTKRAFVERIMASRGLKENSIYLEEKKELPPVEAWLKGIRDAEFVVADSFHGIVFSIIFNTPFIVVESGTGGSARLETLLGKFNLEDRYISGEKAMSYNLDELNNIDWKSVNKKLKKMRKKDGDWLLAALDS